METIYSPTNLELVKFAIEELNDSNHNQWIKFTNYSNCFVQTITTDEEDWPEEVNVTINKTDNGYSYSIKSDGFCGHMYPESTVTSGEILNANV